MNWYKIANKKEMIDKIKNILKNNSFTKKLRNKYEIADEDIDNNMDIKIVDLCDDFAKGNGKEIMLDKSLFKGSFENFLKNNFHFVIHEFFHWLKRRHENSFYFNDPEEIQSFILAIAWEMSVGRKDEDIVKKIYPIVEKHFDNKEESNKMFSEMLSKARLFGN